MKRIWRIRTDLIRANPSDPRHPWPVLEVLEVMKSNPSDDSPLFQPTRRDVLRAGVATAFLGLMGYEGSARGVEAKGSGSITDVAGIKVGHFTDTRRPTGCTVILTEEGAVAGVDVRGAAPGTRETDLLDPINSVQQVHAIMLSGGSAFGLDTASGAMRYLD